MPKSADGALLNKGSQRSIPTEAQLRIAEANLQRTIEWVPRHESRALGLFSVLLGMMGSGIAVMTAERLSHWAFGVASVWMLLFGGTGLACIVYGTFPRTDPPRPSLLFFGSIAALSSDEFVEHFKGRTSADHLNDILLQTHRNAQIIAIKFQSLRIAFAAAVTAIPGWLYLLLAVAPWGGGG